MIKTRSIQLAGRLTRYGDIVLALLVVLTLSVMIIPLPPGVLDLLISFNLAGSVILLLTALYVKHPLKISTFPTILLIGTLFKLALNVCSTRLILQHAYAGEVILSFGNFVVSGNLVVGVIIFAVLVVIQFIVITKGSSRIAEVAARFTLDALPGQQLTIDAEVRAGTLSTEDARRRRRTLGRESQFYGAMDGAMKFVRGDAIASLFITGVNVIGGLIIGILQMDLSPVAAVKLFTLLTVGDGLVSQIPSLLVSITAGILITRVTDPETSPDLGKEISYQLFASPKPFLITSGLLVVFALTPGLPTIPFLVLAALAGVIGHNLLTHPRESQTEIPESSEQTGSLMTSPLELKLSSQAFKNWKDQVARGTDPFDKVKTATMERMGVALPKLIVNRDHNLNNGEYTVYLNQARIACHTDFEPPQSDNIHHLQEALQQLGRRFAHEIQGIQETATLLNVARAEYPDLIDRCVPRQIELEKLTLVLKLLLLEDISIRNLRTILETLCFYDPKGLSTTEITSLVRVGLQREITDRLLGNSDLLEVVLLDREIEMTLETGCADTLFGPQIILEPDIVELILERTQNVLPADKTRPVVILTRKKIRPHVHKLMAPLDRNLKVIAFEELLPETRISAVATITV